VENKKAIVLSGGGARGAYQVGVLKALSHVAKKNNITPKVAIYTGISAGAINAVCMASHAEDFHEGVEKLVRLWGQITSEQVFAMDFAQLGRMAAKTMGQGLTQLLGLEGGTGLLDTSPLKKLISDNVDFDAIERNIEEKNLFAVALTATDYHTSDSITFVQGSPQAPIWRKEKRISRACTLTASHVMASSSIPLLFPPVGVGQRFYGDGSVRNTSPCAPSIYLGANDLLVIGVRLRASTREDQVAAGSTEAPSVARVLNILLNAVLLDGIEMDVERLLRMNNFVEAVPRELQSNLAYRKVDAALISPSIDIGQLALVHAGRLPRVIRYLLKGMGKIEDASEITSYLLFDPKFCQTLIDVGYEDSMLVEDQLVKFWSR
jgi:NTE family protein